jgi:hypothetical protein
MCGLLLVVIGLALQTLGKHPDQQVIGLGAEMAVAGFSFGMIVLAILVLLRGGIGAAATRDRQYRATGPNRTRPTGHPGADARSVPTDHTGPPRRASASFASSGRGDPVAEGVSGGRSPQQNTARRPPKNATLNPTNVYTPGGLLGAPGGGSPGAFAQDQPTPGRSAGPYRPGPIPPPAPTISANAGTGPHRSQGAGNRPPMRQPGQQQQVGQQQPAGQQPGQQQAAGQQPGQQQAAGQQPGRQQPVGQQTWPQQPGQQFAGQQTGPQQAASWQPDPYLATAQQGPQPAATQRGPHPGVPQSGGPRPGTQQGMPQQGAPFPQAAGQRQTPQPESVRPEPGYPAAGDRRTGPISAATSGSFPGSANAPAGTAAGSGFPGSTDVPAGSAATSGNYRGAFEPGGGDATTDDPGMYVYRDDGGPDEPAPASTAAANQQDADNQRDADYWYGPAEPEQSEPQPEARGPFEPLRAGGSAAADGPGQFNAAAEWTPHDAAPSDNVWGTTAGETVDEEPDEAAMHAQKLEQIKDFYMTAEAIGEQNVDKHFDQLLAQQRDLLDQYFKDAKVRITAAAHGEEASAETPAAENAPDSPAGTAQAGAASATTDW